jgi:nitroreductase
MEHDQVNWMDVGTAAMNMMNMAHALGIGTCPVTSFSRSGAAVMLDLPPHLIPEWILIADHPAPQERVLRAGAPKPCGRATSPTGSASVNTNRRIG